MTDQFPPQLPGDLSRQAVPSIKGTVYQAWASIDAWLEIPDSTSVIYLEGAEDFDVIRKDGEAIAVQVKHRADGISLGAKAAQVALLNYWELVTAEPTRKIQMHYLTTSEVVREKDADFAGLPGISAWRAALTNDQVAAEIATYLTRKLPPGSLADFLSRADVSELRTKLLGRFHWLPAQPDLDAVKRSVLSRISDRLGQVGLPRHMAPKVQLHLESRFWEVIVRPNAAERILTYDELQSQIASAATVWIPIQLGRIPEGLAPKLLDLLLEATPPVPQPLLPRPTLIDSVGALVNQRRPVLLTGTVHKGKTTVAQIVAAKLPRSWWLRLSGREAQQVDQLLLSLAERTNQDDFPALLVIDDFDTSPASLRVVEGTLRLLIRRMEVAGRALVITAQGSTIEIGDLNRSLFVVHVSELDEAEIESHCLAHNCPSELAQSWCKAIWLSTWGHPKLVQVSIADLQSRSWPKPSLQDLITPSDAVTAAKHLSRRLLSQTEPPEVAEFLYSTALLTVLMDRKLAQEIAANTPGVKNPGDVVDRLVGKWIEEVGGGSMRATSLLQGAGPDVWNAEYAQAVHARLHDAIGKKGTVNQFEAAAMFFHAFASRDRRRIALTATRLQFIEPETSGEVLRQLGWLPHIALEPRQQVIEDPFSDTAIRGLQFKVAALLNPSLLERIADRWREAVSAIQHDEARLTSQVILWSSVGVSESEGISFKARLSAVAGMQSIQNSDHAASDILRRALPAEKGLGIPDGALPAQVMLAMAAKFSKGIESIEALIDWLEGDLSCNARNDIETVLGWPLTQTLGAYVQGAWVAAQDSVSDWDPWLAVLDRLISTSSSVDAPRLGCEAAKAKAIVLAEYKGDTATAIRVLDEAERTFGDSPLLVEQRANVYFQSGKDDEVLRLWKQQFEGFDAAESELLDPFAYRRFGISAARLHDYGTASSIFNIGAQVAHDTDLSAIGFALAVDAANAQAFSGNFCSAVELLCRAVDAIPDSAEEDGDQRWEAVQRGASDVARQIEQRCLPEDAGVKIKPGDLSAPSFQVKTSAPGQVLRTRLLEVASVRLSGCFCIRPPDALITRSHSLEPSAPPFIRYQICEARLAEMYRDGLVAGFVTQVASLQSSLQLMARCRDRLLVPSDEQSDLLESSVNDVIGLLVAALCCTAQPPSATLSQWSAEAERVWGAESSLAGMFKGALEEMNQGLRAPSALARCASAVIQLRSDHLEVPAAVQLQALLTSGMVMDGARYFQPLYSLAVARQFAERWEVLVQNPFRLPNPAKSQAKISLVLGDIKRGKATLGELMRTLLEVVGGRIPDFLSVVR